MDRKPVSFFDELFPHSPWRRPSPLEIEALGGNGMVDIESLSNQNGEEISSFSKSSANSVENISTNSKKLEETNNKTALDQENLGFEVSRGAENVKNLSNQDGQEISSSKFTADLAANISTNTKKLEETKNKTALDQENLDFEVSRGDENAENLSNQDGQEISTSKFPANLAANISTNTRKLEETKNKTALDQENLDFEVSRGAENVENLSNQDGQEISSSKFPANLAANISTNSKKREETKNKIGFDQENLRFEASTDIESFLQKRNVDNENLSLPACSNQVTETEFTAKLDENNSANIGDEVAKIKTSLKPLNLDFETSSEMDDTENLPSPSCSNQDDFDFSLSSPPKSVEKTSKLEENTAKLEENIIVDEQEIETTRVKGDLNLIKRTLNFDTASVHLESEREILRDEMPQFNENLVEVNYS